MLTYFHSKTYFPSNFLLAWLRPNKSFLAANPFSLPSPENFLAYSPDTIKGARNTSQKQTLHCFIISPTRELWKLRLKLSAPPPTTSIPINPAKKLLNLIKFSLLADRHAYREIHLWVFIQQRFHFKQFCIEFLNSF